MGRTAPGILGTVLGFQWGTDMSIAEIAISPTASQRPNLGFEERCHLPIEGDYIQIEGNDEVTWGHGGDAQDLAEISGGL